MKKYIQLLFILFLIFSVRIPAEKSFYHSPQSKETLSDTLKGKTSLQRDTSVQRIKKEIILPVERPSLHEHHLENSILSKEKLVKMDYRTTANFFTNTPFGFVRDLGSVGQPTEVLIYGSGFGNVSFMSDGIPINNRLSNTLDLNLFQSESIDSIEIIPLARGFLFGNFSNPVSINLITRETAYRKPFSRLKYYQGANSEGMIDGIFNITPFSKLNTYFEISNQSTKPYYENTDYSNWSGTSRLRYLLSKSINLIASYRYVKSVVQLNGGVDADSINDRYSPSQFNAILYDKFQAPVRFTNRYHKAMVNDFRLSILSNFFDNSTTDLSFYYQSSLTEFRQNEYSLLDESKVKNIADDNFHKTVGVNLFQKLKLGLVDITSTTNTERSTFNTPMLSREIVKSSFSESLVAAMSLLENSFVPSLYARYLNYSNKSYIGFGADAVVRINNMFKVYAGISSYQRPYSIWEERFALPNATISDKQNNRAAELSLVFEDSSTNISINYFLQSKKNSLLSSSFINNSGETQTLFFVADELNLNGLNLKLDIKLWKILFSTNSSFYFSPQSRKDFKLPDYTSTGGIYYIDTLFNSNLHLKTGFTYYSIGTRDFINYDFEKNISSYYNFNPSLTYPDIINTAISQSFQIDFFLAGRIQNSATIYFVFENLLDTKYFVVPYYPKQARGIRFGVAWEFLD
ncbi:hypothetical protein C0389_06960 [bacterium]|nr:hypothetical protein [bacterium]